MELFNGLMNLCDTNEAFYYTDQEYDDHRIVRSFSYRLASWTDFQEPYALECRGTAYLFDDRTQEWSLFTRAMKKFFNIGEGIPKDEFIENNPPVVSYEKLDGSLILAGIIDDRVVLKSKTSINSDQASQAQDIVDNNPLIRVHLHNLISGGFSPVMELVGPSNRIVLPYEKDELVMLGVIENETGEFTCYEDDELGFMKVAENYHLSCSLSVEEAIKKLGDKKFDTFNEFCDFLNGVD